VAEKNGSGVDSGIVCLAVGGNSVVRTRRISLVSTLASAILDVSFYAVDCRLDREHLPHIH